MKKKISDPDFPVEPVTRVKDMLPPPDQLVIPESTTKVTLHLSTSSVRFFKRQAARHGTKYQKMIRTLVDRYAEHHST